MHSDFSRGSYVKTCKNPHIERFQHKERCSDRQTNSEEDSKKKRQKYGEIATETDRHIDR